MNKIDQIVNLIRKNLVMDKGNNLINQQQILDEDAALESLISDLDDRKKLLEEYAVYKKIRTKKGSKQQIMLQKIMLKVRHLEDAQKLRKRKIVRLRMIGVAASVCICLGILFWQVGVHQKSLDGTGKISEFSVLKPGKNTATLRIQGLDESIDLNSDQDGIVVGDQIRYKDGSEIAAINTKIAENPRMELVTPKGGEYQITLSDGTRITLNAASRLTYPRTFGSDQRIVELVGEAYFEVAKDENKPFIVKTATEDITVLGTHFNVNAYQDETRSFVSLIEGRVQVSSPETSKILVPGQQSVTSEGTMIVQKINVEEVLAWKNGEFMFNNESLEDVMHKLSRWYNIEVIVSPELKHLAIWGSVSRYDSFDKVLEIIEMTNESIKFRKEGRRVYIMK